MEISLEKYELKRDIFVGFDGGYSEEKPNKKELLISCDCLGEVVSVIRYKGEEEVYINIYKFMSSSVSFFTRLKWTWKVIMGKGISTADVVLSKENFNKIKKF